jgi:gas vesicle protein
MSQTRCFFYGLGVGVAAGILMAPRSGAKTQQKIMSAARDGRDYLARQTDEVRSAVMDKVERTKRAATATAEGLGVAFEVGKEQLMG